MPSAMSTPTNTGFFTRSKRHAAQAVSTAAATGALSDDPLSYPFVPPATGRRSTGLDAQNLDTHHQQVLRDEMANDHRYAHNVPHDAYVPGRPGERQRVVQALQSPLHDDVAWALGTLNALSFDVNNSFIVTDFPGLLDALHIILGRYMEDILGKRSTSTVTNNTATSNGLVEYDKRVPRVTPLSSIDINHAGDTLTQNTDAQPHNANMKNLKPRRDRTANSQRYANLFNVTDAISVDREQCAVVTGNVLRNMSFHDRNALMLASAAKLFKLTAIMIEHVAVSANLRDALMDMWINVAPYLNASDGHSGHYVLSCCVRLLDPFKDGADMARFTNCGEVLARLAASPDRNEKPITEVFDIMLPRLVDMLGGRQRKYVNAGLAALCNFSAFDWPARDEIARVPRTVDRLIVMLSDPELAPRAAVTLLNLAESPSNRSVLMVYERRFAEFALTSSPAADTVCSILFTLEYD